MDSMPAVTKHRQEASGLFWSCIPSGSGLFLYDAEERGFFLPSPRCEGETVLVQPPLAVELSPAEIDDLVREDRPYATTRYGPELQEKASNQDFALSSLITDGGGGQWSFGAIADGVSVATFWPERAARLACLASYRFFRKILVNRSGLDLGDRALLDLKRRLVAELRSALEDDRQRLRHSQRPMVPPTFTPEEYRSRWDSDEVWFKTTLLIGLVGPEHGFVFWSGDGGIWLRRQGGTGSSVKRVLGGADGPLQRFVWLGVKEKDFSVGRIPLEDQETATLALASDGLDRTLALAEIGYEMLLPSGAPGPRRQYLKAYLDKIYGAEGRRRGKQPEPDNASLVVLEWIRHRRFSGAIEKQPRFALAEVQAPPPAAHPPPEPERVSSPPPETAPPSKAALQPTAAGPLQTPPLRGSVEAHPPSVLPQKGRDGGNSRGRTLPTPRPVVVVVLGVAVIAALLAWFSDLRLLGVDKDSGEEAANDSPEDASATADEPETSLGTGAPVRRPTEDGMDPENLGQELTHAPDSGPIPSGPIEFAVLGSGSLLQEAIGPPPQASAEALVRELAEWSKQARLLSARGGSAEVTVVAYGDRDNPTLEGCRDNDEVARKRAELFAELLQLFMPEVTVHAAWNACEAPPGISNHASTEARRLVLFPGHQVFHCDCNDVAWAKS